MIWDVLIIGAGPGGYVCAIRAAQLGLKVAVIERRATPGGTCLNIGCIPSKALLHASERWQEAQKEFPEMGIHAEKLELDLGAMQRFKEKIVTENVRGIGYLFRKNKVQLFQGVAKLLSPSEVEVCSDSGERKKVTARSIVIATGSEAAQLHNVDIDEVDIVTSTGALTFSEVPRRLVVVGAGVIGLELGSVWNRLGSEVTVVEFSDGIIPGADRQAGEMLRSILAKQGLNFRLNCSVDAVERHPDQNLSVMVSSRDTNQRQTICADKVLVAIGRRPASAGLGLRTLGIETEASGTVRVGSHFETIVQGVYAIGDVVPGPMLAHKAADEGYALAEHLAGRTGYHDPRLIPGVVYTHPEFAWIGESAESLTEQGREFRVGSFPFQANGRARTMNVAEGMVRILADEATDQVLGAQIVGPSAGEIIHELVSVMEFSGSSEDIALTCHAHPTLAEAIREAALSVTGSPIHS